MITKEQYLKVKYGKCFIELLDSDVCVLKIGGVTIVEKFSLTEKEIIKFSRKLKLGRIKNV